MQMQRSFV